MDIWLYLLITLHFLIWLWERNNQIFFQRQNRKTLQWWKYKRQWWLLWQWHFRWIRFDTKIHYGCDNSHISRIINILVNSIKKDYDIQLNKINVFKMFLILYFTLLTLFLCESFIYVPVKYDKAYFIDFTLGNSNLNLSLSQENDHIVADYFEYYNSRADCCIIYKGQFGYCNK